MSILEKIMCSITITVLLGGFICYLLVKGADGD